MLRVRDREAPELPLVAKVWGARAAFVEETRAEFALLARLRSPSLARAHDLGFDVRTRAPFLVEELVTGRDLREELARLDALANEDPAAANHALARVVADLLVALSTLHRSGFLHGDVKPAHVRFRDDGESSWPVLLDLGSALPIAARTEGERSGMTRKYAAPELFQGDPKTVATDLFALGASVRACLGEVERVAEPAILDVLAALTRAAPDARPRDTDAALEALGRAVALRGARATKLRLAVPATHGRETELASLAASRGVIYVTGEAGIGKSHVVRELFVRAKIEGREARYHAFPDVPAEVARDLAKGLREGVFESALDAPAPLVVIDGLDRAPREIGAALEAFRCRTDPSPWSFVVAARRCPAGAASLLLGPLDDRHCTTLGRALGLTRGELLRTVTAAKGLPAFVVAASGNAALLPEHVLRAAQKLPEQAKDALFVIAAALGAIEEHALPLPLADLERLLASGLVARTGTRPPKLGLFAKDAANDVADALTSDARVLLAATIVLDPKLTVPPEALLALARRASVPPAVRQELRAEAANRARKAESNTTEIEALLDVCELPSARSRDVLLRLERLLRDTGKVPAHPTVVAWLTEASLADPSLLPLAKRRRAEAEARAGHHDTARGLADEALALAKVPFDVAAAHATAGALALYRADPLAAKEALTKAEDLFSKLAHDDVEERARLAHNRAACAIYLGDDREAEALLLFALAEKRKLGDRAGCRACLSNLGLVRRKLGDLDGADAALDEAVRLSISLDQTQGRAWCLAVRAEVALARSDPNAAARDVREARALGAQVPLPIQADLSLLDAEIALLSERYERIRPALASLDASARGGDPLVDARALVLEAEASLAEGDRREATRSAARAVRRAREANISHLVARAWGIVREARMKGPPRSLAAWLDSAARGASRDEQERTLLEGLVKSTRAERGFLVDVASGRVLGLDAEGLLVGEAEKRVDLAELARLAKGPARVVHEGGSPGSRVVVLGPPPSATLVVLEERRTADVFRSVADGDLLPFVAAFVVAARLSAPRREVDAPASATSAQESAPAAASREVAAGPYDEETTFFPQRNDLPKLPSIVGKSLAIDRARARLAVAARGDLPVLLTGETGVGKEIFARALHSASARERGPFVAVNCGAIAENLFEAELFGHVKGAYTGAERARRGLFAAAEGGTLFLDEIGELPLAKQATFLRVLETRRYRAVGDDEERTVDVRIVAATNRDLEAQVAAGTFRRDLYFRLSVLTVDIPPLRSRTGDVRELVRHFVDAAGVKLVLSDDAWATLDAHVWPGNVRELQHEIARLLAQGVSNVGRSALSRKIREGSAARAGSAPSAAPEASGARERNELERALAANEGNLTHTATALGLSRQGLKKRMIRLGMREKKGDVEP